MGRLLGFVGTLATLAIGMYIYSLQVKAIAPGATVADDQSTATITGVKNDLIAIGNAERAHMASQGGYASLDELVSGSYLTIRPERPPYIYDVEADSGGFRATATRTTQGAPAQIWITGTMEIQASN